MGDTEGTAHLAQIGGLFARNQDRLHADHENFAEPREPGDDVLGQAVGEIGLTRIVACVLERQHRDRRPVWQWRVLGRLLQRRIDFAARRGSALLADVAVEREGLGLGLDTQLAL